jgi:glycosyltransferase involved in cell wall biosynthesis
MHLCVVSPFPPELTGVGQYGWNVVRGLAGRDGFSAITVLAQHPGESGLVDAALPVGQVRVRRVWAPDDHVSAAQLARRVREERPDVAWFNLGYTVFGASRTVNFLGLLAPFVARRLGVPTVVTLHQVFEVTPPRSVGAKNGYLTTLGARVATRLLLRAGTVCVTLGRYKAALQAHYGADNVHHIPHGAYVAPEALPYPSAPAEDILFFGSLAPFKGLDTLLEAFERLRSRRPLATLTIAGSVHPRFPGYQDELRQRVQARDGSGLDGVRWLGALPESELRGLFARARVVALPYLASTGASSVLYRAVTYGRPVVASDLVDLRMATDEDGLRIDYVPPADPAALAAALEQLLADPARQAAHARHNLHAMRGMTLDHTCARYLRLFEQVRAGRPERASARSQLAQ